MDLSATKAVVERFLEAGVSGISSLGSTVEFSHLLGGSRGQHEPYKTRSNLPEICRHAVHYGVRSGRCARQIGRSSCGLSAGCARTAVW